MWMVGRFGENILDDAPGQLARALILLEDDEHGHAGFNGRAGLSIHDNFLLSPSSLKVV